MKGNNLRLMNEEEFINGLDIEMNSDDVESICLKCKNKSLVSDFIYDEFSRYIAHNELKGKKVATIYCNECGALKMVPINILEEN